MGSPYLKSTESILLSTNNVLVNSVPAEAILTDERLMLLDTRSTELRPQEIPFPAVGPITIDDNADGDPELSISLVTGPDLTTTLLMVFPQKPKMLRVSERDEWAARIRELASAALRGRERAPVELHPPWVPGTEEESGEETAPAAPGDSGSGFRNPPLVPRKQKKTADQTPPVAVLVVILLIIGAAIVILFNPGLVGMGTTPVVTPVPTPVVTTVPTILPTTPAATAKPTVTKTPVPAGTTPGGILVPSTGVWVLVNYEGSYNGTAGAPGRFRTITGTGSHAFQIPAKDEIVTATVQKQDNSGRKLTVEIYDTGKLVKSGSVSSPSGTVSIGVDLRAP